MQSEFNDRTWLRHKYISGNLYWTANSTKILCESQWLLPGFQFVLSSNCFVLPHIVSNRFFQVVLFAWKKITLKRKEEHLLRHHNKRYCSYSVQSCRSIESEKFSNKMKTETCCNNGRFQTNWSSQVSAFLFDDLLCRCNASYNCSHLRITFGALRNVLAFASAMYESKASSSMCLWIA